MQKLTLADIEFPAVYEEHRAAFRAHIIALKRNRRITLGDRVAIVFENRETMRFQIQEMCRVEGIADQAGVQAEVEVYNSLIPDAGELCATLLIEVADSAQVKPVLDSFLGLDAGECVRLEFAGERVAATFEAGHSEEDRISAVHYLRFRFAPGQVGRFAACDHAALVLDHPACSDTADLPPATLAALRGDLGAATP